MDRRTITAALSLTHDIQPGEPLASPGEARFECASACVSQLSADPRQASLTPIGLVRALPVAGLSFARRDRAPTDVTASARSHRQVISSARRTEFPCRLWNALRRAKSMKTGILRLATKNSPTDRDDDRRGSRSDVADRYQLFPVSNRRRNPSIIGDLRAF